MQPILEKIFAVQDECTALGWELKECLREEREALIGLKLDSLLTTSSRKEDLLQQLKRKRVFFRLLLKEHLGFEDSTGLDSGLEGEDKKAWGIKRFEWLKTWEQIKNSCEGNYRLMERTQKNQDLFVGHLKQLLGQQPLYSPKGVRVESHSSGRVVEGRY
jgi:hypothetical protein